MTCRTPRTTLIVLTATALLLSTWFSATAVIPQVRAEWQLSAEAVAWLTIAVQWGSSPAQLLSAMFTIADAIAPTRLIFLCSLGQPAPTRWPWSHKASASASWRGLALASSSRGSTRPHSS